MQLLLRPIQILAFAALIGRPIEFEAQTILVQPYLQNATPASMVIMWETNVNTETTLQYGLTTSLGSSLSGTAITTLGSTQLHTASLTGLSAATRYYYKAKTGSWESSIFNFVTPPSAGSEQNFNIVLMSDMQKDGGNPNIFSNLINTSLLPYIANTYGTPLNDHLQMAVLPGDVVDAGNNYLQYKNDFFNPGQALWSFVPSYPAIGNHEVNSPNYFNYFNLPANGSPDYLEHWYSHDYSNVRVLSFDSNPTYRIQQQLNWLDSMLNITCNDQNIDFVFAQMHHPHKSELWVPGECDYTGDILHRMEMFSDSCGKPTIHFFGHTHAYSRGQSRDHQHLWVNVATSGGNIDHWGEFQNKDYDEFIVSQDEYGFVMVEVTAGADPRFTLKRLSFGDENNPGGSNETDIITVHRYNNAPSKPNALFPMNFDTVSPFCTIIKADGFSDPNEEGHSSTHWQVSNDSVNFAAPLFESWKQYANWYNEIDLQAGDDLTDEAALNLPAGSTLWWRVRYRDKGLTWSSWSTSQRFHTQPIDTLSTNLVLNPGAESGITNWTATTGVIESLNPLECAGINPYSGQKYFAVGALCIEYPFASANQVIDVASFAGAIDAGNVLVNYGAYLADWANTDEPSFALQFLNSGGNVISGTDTIRHQTSTWTLKQNVVSVPVNTRSIRFILMGTRFAGTDNDSYFDQVFLKLLQGDLNCDEYIAPGPINGRIYVDHTAIGNPANGESWTTAYRTVGDAIAQSNIDTAIHEIWIADGNYKVTTDTNRDSSFHLTRSVKIYGGFEGNEWQLSQRDIPNHVTLLSGDIGNPGMMADNSYQVIKIENTLDTVRLDGLKICCGYADGEDNDKGGGVYYDLSNHAYLILDHCMIENNVAENGSSIYNSWQTILKNCNVQDEEVPGLTGCSILNEGVKAVLSLNNVIIGHQFTSCTEVIRNLNGAKLIVIDSATLEKH